MRTLLYNFFLSHWERKVVSLILAVIIWLMLNHSQTQSQILENVAVRVINIPSGMTVEGIQPNGILSKRISLNVRGDKKYIEELTANDLEVVLDAADKSGDWIATIKKNNLVPLNLETSLSKIISSLPPHRILISLTRLVTEKIPVSIALPIGDSPANYQFLDIWPHHLFLTVSGPEKVIKELKKKEFSLVFDLNKIAKTDLDLLQRELQQDEVSFLVPDEWKQLNIPELSDLPISIDDPEAQKLSINFLHSELYPIKNIPLSLFYPPEYSSIINPQTCQTIMGDLIHSVHGLYVINKTLYAKGASRLFMNLVEDMIEISISLAPKNEQQSLNWSVQFINPRLLEDRYTATLLSEMITDKNNPSAMKSQEERLRHRFRNYMNHFQFYRSKEEKFDLTAELQEGGVIVRELN